MSTRTRIVILAITTVVVIGAAAAFVVRARVESEQAQRRPARVATASIDRLGSRPRIAFRNTTLGSELGRVAVVPLAEPGGARAFTDLSCDRVFQAEGVTLCLASEAGVVTTYKAFVVDTQGKRTDLPLTGSPSRARLSPDGRLAATTSFVAGDSYAATGFSTRTVVTDLRTSRSADLETFTLISGGKAIRPLDRNYWGVTFAADGDRFYVTVAYGGRTHLAEGSLKARRVTTIRTDAECPSLSPDGTRVAYKKRGDRSRGDWRLVVLDLATKVETPLAEQRSVDDQVEWLDDRQILYGLPGEGTRAAETNVWVSAADGTGAPRLLIENAWSPAVVR